VKELFIIIIKANVQIVDINSHTGALHCWSIALSMTCCCSQTMQLSGAAPDQQRLVWACGRHAPAWSSRLYSQLESARDYSVATAPGEEKCSVAYIWCIVCHKNRCSFLQGTVQTQNWDV